MEILANARLGLGGGPAPNPHPILAPNPDPSPSPSPSPNPDQVTIMPRYVLVNLSPFDLEVTQSGLHLSTDPEDWQQLPRCAAGPATLSDPACNPN